MRITPLDVRKQEFRKAVRGYDSDEVRGFLATLAEEYEVVLVDNKTLREASAKQEEKLADYQKLEQTLRDTLMTAQRAMSESKENATREGELIVQEARQQAAQILAECRSRTDELRRETIMLRREKETYLARFRALAEAQIKFVDTHEQDFAASDDRMEEMASTMATEASAPVAQASFRPADIAPETPRQSEVPRSHESDQDVWRDYAPLTAADTTPPAVEPTAEPAAPTSGPEDPQPGAERPATGWSQRPVQETAPTAQSDPETDREMATEKAVSSLTEAVEFASLGIPVPASGEAGEKAADELPTEPQVTAPV